jgi:hypothetical protein
MRACSRYCVAALLDERRARVLGHMLHQGKVVRERVGSDSSRYRWARARGSRCSGRRSVQSRRCARCGRARTNLRTAESDCKNTRCVSRRLVVYLRSGRRLPVCSLVTQQANGNDKSPSGLSNCAWQPCHTQAERERTSCFLFRFHVPLKRTQSIDLYLVARCRDAKVRKILFLCFKRKTFYDYRVC